MPRKQHTISDAERAKRLREAERKLGGAEGEEAFERAFKRIVPAKNAQGAGKPRRSQSSRES